MDASPVNFAELERHRAALTGHCYRMLGSATDAEDAVQETMLRAFRGLASFDGRAALRSWLCRIATNVCLDFLASKQRRTRPVLDGPVGSPTDELEHSERVHWLEPIADAQALPHDVGAEELLVLRQSIRLAFVAALQNLTAKQRAALLLTDVLGWSVAEAADCLQTTTMAINSALQRARSTLDAAAPVRDEPLTPERTDLMERYVAAFERYDVDSLLELFHEDATLSMPPYRLWLQGHAAMREWLLGRGIECRGSRLIPTAACGSEAAAQYRPDPNGGHRAWALVVLERRHDRYTALNSFLDVETLFPLFGLPLTLPA